MPPSETAATLENAAIAEIAHLNVVALFTGVLDRPVFRKVLKDQTGRRRAETTH
jgi:hypothetical protein